MCLVIGVSRILLLLCLRFFKSMSAVLWKAKIDALTLLSCFLRGREFGHRVCIKEFASWVFVFHLSLSLSLLTRKLPIVRVREKLSFAACKWQTPNIQTPNMRFFLSLNISGQAMAVAVQPTREVETKKKPLTRQRRVVVTGMGVVSPLGHDPGVFYNNLLQGVSGVTRIEAFDCAQFPTVGNWFFQHIFSSICCSL